MASARHRHLGSFIPKPAVTAALAAALLVSISTGSEAQRDYEQDPAELNRVAGQVADWMRLLVPGWAQRPRAHFILLADVSESMFIHRNDLNMLRDDICQWILAEEPVIRPGDEVVLVPFGDHAHTPRLAELERSWTVGPETPPASVASRVLERLGGVRPGGNGTDLEGAVVYAKKRALAIADQSPDDAVFIILVTDLASGDRGDAKAPSAEPLPPETDPLFKSTGQYVQVGHLRMYVRVTAYVGSRPEEPPPPEEPPEERPVGGICWSDIDGAPPVQEGAPIDLGETAQIRRLTICNTADVPHTWAVRAPLPPWLVAEPLSGELAPAATVHIVLQVDRRHLRGEEATTVLVIDTSAGELQRQLRVARGHVSRRGLVWPGAILLLAGLLWGAFGWQVPLVVCGTPMRLRWWGDSWTLQAGKPVRVEEIGEIPLCRLEVRMAGITLTPEPNIQLFDGENKLASSVEIRERKETFTGAAGGRTRFDITVEREDAVRANLGLILACGCLIGFGGVLLGLGIAG